MQVDVTFLQMKLKLRLKAVGNILINYIKILSKKVTVVLKKIKVLRENFSQIITNVRRSGSRKVVLEYYDDPVTLWRGSTATVSLSCGISPNDISLLICHYSFLLVQMISVTMTLKPMKKGTMQI